MNNNLSKEGKLIFALLYALVFFLLALALELDLDSLLRGLL